MVGIPRTRKSIRSKALFPLEQPNGTALIIQMQMVIGSKISSRKQLISPPESKTIKRKNPKIAPNFSIKEKKP